MSPSEKSEKCGINHMLYLHLVSFSVAHVKLDFIARVVFSPWTLSYIDVKDLKTHVHCDHFSLHIFDSILFLGKSLAYLCLFPIPHCRTTLCNLNWIWVFPRKGRNSCFSWEEVFTMHVLLVLRGKKHIWPFMKKKMNGHFLRQTHLLHFN